MLTTNNPYWDLDWKYIVSGYNYSIGNEWVRVNPHLNKEEEKEKKEVMKTDKFKDSYFIYDGNAYRVDDITIHHELGIPHNIHTADVSVNLNEPFFTNVEYYKFDVESTMELYKETKAVTQPKIKNVIFNEPATIVFWEDGTKTVVKAQSNDVFDPEKGLAMAMAKKFLGNQGNYYNEFAKWLPEEEIEMEQPMGKVIETIDSEDGFTIRFRPNEAMKKAFEKLAAVRFDIPTSIEFIADKKDPFEAAGFDNETCKKAKEMFELVRSYGIDISEESIIDYIRLNGLE